MHIAKKSKFSSVIVHKTHCYLGPHIITAITKIISTLEHKSNKRLLFICRRIIKAGNITLTCKCCKRQHLPWTMSHVVIYPQSKADVFSVTAQYKLHLQLLCRPGCCSKNNIFKVHRSSGPLWIIMIIKKKWLVLLEFYTSDSETRINDAN